MHMFFPRRQQISTASEGATSDYGQAVFGVNKLLDSNGINISERSKNSVIDNVKKVETGERSEINAHQREAVTFARDSFVSASEGRYRQAAVEATGSVLNTLGSMYKSLYTPTPAERRGLDPT